MKRFLTALIAVLCLNALAMAETKTVNLRLIQTSDVHGCFFPWDFINRKPKGGTLARVSTYVNELRKTYGNRLILVDNGDILQGQPTCYYSNYVKPNEPNIAAKVINYMRYDAETMGNHDIETGHKVYDKWIKEVKCPMLGANIIDVATGKPYVHPYTIIERDGVKVAIVGMITPAIPNWLNENLWKGLRFDEMVKTANYWMEYIKEHDNPDVIIGLFHSGKEGGITTDTYQENASAKVAAQVPGFDAVLYGHDHTLHDDIVDNKDGEKVVCLDPACYAFNVSDLDITVVKDGNRLISKKVAGKLVNVEKYSVDEQFMKYFKTDIDNVNAFVGKKIGTFKNSISTRDCFFGSSAFCDFIHNLQLQITGADVSFNAPLSFDSSIKAGPVYVADMFNLYKYENQIYVLKMTGEEIRKHLEMSYDQWVNTMKSPDDHILLLDQQTKDGKSRYTFKNMSFNFDSAAGIDYEVDVTKPDGQKVKILRMSNGAPFDEHKWYKVVMNSYRGNGGGELLTRGAGIPKDSLQSRVLWESERDQRYYLTQEIEKAGTMDPKPNNNWRFVPDAWAKPALQRDRQLLFAKTLSADEEK